MKMSEEKSRDYFLFIRLSEEEFADSLLYKGEIYCNTLDYFRSLKEDNFRGDKNEGRAQISQVKNLRLKLKEQTFEVGDAQLYYTHPDDIGNIYCIYGVQTNLINFEITGDQKVKINPEFIKDASYAIVIYNPGEFIDRVSKTLTDLNYKFDFHPVNYYDEKNYNGELSPFYKSNFYDYQSEVRLWIPNKENKPIQFQIGSIEDIAIKLHVKDLNKLSVEI